MKVLLDSGAKMPTRAHDTDAGIDIYSREEKVISANGGSETFDTGVHLEIAPGYVGFLKSKSGLNVNMALQAKALSTRATREVLLQSFITIPTAITQ